MNLLVWQKNKIFQGASKAIRYCTLFVITAVVFFSATSVNAQSGWKAVLGAHENTPEFIVAVDKSLQKLKAFERQSPMRQIAEYLCSTGQATGDKLVQGDLKTPEGIYFVKRHITSGLDFTLYGHEAYTLNYPNPIDRLRKKTGSGIWIHGKGIPLVPLGTHGCVGMNNQDIATLGKKFFIGMPVALAEGIVFNAEASSEHKETVKLLDGKVRSWANAWASRSSQLFDFYDSEAYSIAQGSSFKNFKTQKEYLFKHLPWIEIDIDNIQILEGPGYWVTWFNQFYKAPNLQTKGQRRLYWQKDKSGEFRIVGMEWVPGLQTKILVADASAQPVVLPGTESKTEPIVKNTSGLQSLSITKDAPSLQELADASAFSTSPVQKESSAEREARLTQEAEDFIEIWRQAWLNAELDDYLECYSLTAVQGKNNNRESIAAQKKKLWKRTTPVEIEFSNIRLKLQGTRMNVTMLQYYADAFGRSDEGIKNLILEYSGQRWRIVNESWSQIRK